MALLREIKAAMTNTILAVMLVGAASIGTYARGADLKDNEAWRASVGTDGVQRINLQCGPNYFDPHHVIVKVNVPVEISLHSPPNMAPHHFVLDLSKISLSEGNPAGSTTKQIRFIPKTIGEHPFGCQDNAAHPHAPPEAQKMGLLTVIP